MLGFLKKALEIEPNFFKAQTNLSNTYLDQQKNIEKAVTESHKALTIYHVISKIYSQSVPLFRLKHDIEQAEYLESKNYKINGLNEFNKIGKEILNKKEELFSEITCPDCGHRKTEEMPTDACIYFYECKGCGTLLKPNQGDCCVFCSFGTVPCPPIQEARATGSETTCCG